MVDEDKTFEDEYAFDDMEDIGVSEEESYKTDSLEPPETTPTESPPPEKSKNVVLRNALITVGMVVLLMLGYRFLSSPSTKPSPPKPIAQITPVAPVASPAPPPIVQEPVLTETERQKIQEELQTLKTNEQDLRTDLTNLSSQISTLNTNISTLTQQVESLSHTVSALSTKVDNELANLKPVPPEPVKLSKIVICPKIKKPAGPTTYFHLQAIIPGRAWLIGTNGATLTVREGSIVPGYGVVKLIDAVQGRVLMRSGRVIEFSQQDS